MGAKIQYCSFLDDIALAQSFLSTPNRTGLRGMFAAILNGVILLTQVL